MNDREFERYCREIIDNQYQSKYDVDEIKQKMQAAKANAIQDIKSVSDLTPDKCKYNNFVVGSFKVVKYGIPTVYLEVQEKNLKIDKKVKDLERVIPNQSLLNSIMCGKYSNDQFLEFLYYLLKYDQNKYLY